MRKAAALFLFAQTLKWMKTENRNNRNMFAEELEYLDGVYAMIENETHPKIIKLKTKAVAERLRRINFFADVDAFAFEQHASTLEEISKQY